MARENALFRLACPPHEKRRSRPLPSAGRGPGKSTKDTPAWGRGPTLLRNGILFVRGVSPQPSCTPDEKKGPAFAGPRASLTIEIPAYGKTGVGSTITLSRVTIPNGALP